MQGKVECSRKRGRSKEPTVLSLQGEKLKAGHSGNISVTGSLYVGHDLTAHNKKRTDLLYMYKK